MLSSTYSSVELDAAVLEALVLDETLELVPLMLVAATLLGEVPVTIVSASVSLYVLVVESEALVLANDPVLDEGLVLVLTFLVLAALSLV